MVFVLISLGQACSESHFETFIDKSEAEISEIITNPILANNCINRQSCMFEDDHE
jgi:hypothetical protein